jgi:enoyl-CoA hydratase/carnithine racemase
MSSFQYETVLSALDDDGVRTLALNRPGSLNAMNRQLIDDVARAFDEANADPATRAIIFTGDHLHRYGPGLLRGRRPP